MKKLALGLSLALLFSNLTAEVISVKVRWNDVACARDCRIKLESIFRQMNGAAGISMDPGFGEATITWNPTASFNVDTVIAPLRQFGIKPMAVNITVRGTVSHSGDQFYLTANGTRFLLLGPSQVELNTNRYVMERSAANHPIDGALKTRLLQAQNDGEPIIIDGSMFNVEQHTNNIVINSITASDKS